MAGLRQSKTAENYHRLLLYAFDYRGFDLRGARTPLDPVQRLIRNGKEAFSESLKFGAHAEPVTFDDEEGIPSSHLSLQREVTYPDNLEDIINSGEFPEEHAVIRNSVSVPSNISQKPLLDRLYRRLLARRAAIANQRRFWWEVSTLPISSIADVLERLITAHLDDQASFNTLAALAYVTLVVFTGQDPDNVAESDLLQNWSAAKASYEKPRLFFDQNSNCLAYLIDRQTLGYYRGDTPDFVNQCCPTSPWVVLTLHPVVISVLRCYLNQRAKLPSIPSPLSNRIFLLTGGEHIEPLTAASINLRFNTLQRGAISSSCTIQGLAKSVVTHLTTQFGLDPLLACYLSGKVPFNLRAQMFYTHVSVDEFNVRISSAIYKFAEQIRDEFGDNNTSERVKEFWRNQRIDGIGLSEAPRSWKGTGSRCVMTNEAIRAFFATYRNQLSRLQDQIGKYSPLQDRILLFNLVILHNYLIYQFSTGIRPLKDPPVTAHTIRQINAEDSAVILRDKRNIRFPEAREVPHAAIAQEALRLCAEAIATLRSMLSREGIRIDKWWQEHDQPFFFVLSEHGTPQHLSPSAIGHWLAAVEGLSPLYLVPKNAPRHYLRSSLFREGFSLAFIDRIMGHMHAGHEPTSVLAATDIKKANAQFITHVARIAADLGLEPFAYSLR